VPLVYAGFGALMITTLISYVSHSQVGTTAALSAKWVAFGVQHNMNLKRRKAVVLGMVRQPYTHVLYVHSQLYCGWCRCSQWCCCVCWLWRAHDHNADQLRQPLTGTLLEINLVVKLVTAAVPQLQTVVDLYRCSSTGSHSQVGRARKLPLKISTSWWRGLGQSRPAAHQGASGGGAVPFGGRIGRNTPLPGPEFRSAGRRPSQSFQNFGPPALV
jgi:hypothetical protein